ncbi:multiple C2 and transmembrane domain-containing protein isoform X2 [Chrysoperla carnea]|uniref:multiple C2 and transmembrane domain-containing protein isoform X2 n=1 Tax=Chrysoperla carnea TaxID=189513 RepID=UPI001D07198C|nr:multiple C2 and transmembrane domain-containing protein isoform X2 [Chrysoperla carnea]
MTYSVVGENCTKLLRQLSTSCTTMLSNSNCCDSPVITKRARLNLESNEDIYECGADGETEDRPLGRHLSKSASELSSPRELHEPRPYSAAPASQHHIHNTVVQKTHNFFSTLKSRWSRSKSRSDSRSGGRRKSPIHHHDSTDYAADLSSDHSSPSTQSPRHKQHLISDSPLSRGGRTESQVVLNTISTTPDNSPRRPRGSLFNITSSGSHHSQAVPSTSLNEPAADEATRKREAALRQHSFFQLRVHLRRGNNLAAMDKNGTSDPYVKFKLGGRLVYKSRTVYRELNPLWDESFTIPIEDPFIPLQIKVFDYDWGLQDDFMGATLLDLTTLDLGRLSELVLDLHDPSKPNANLGELHLSVTLWPRTQEDKDQYFQKNAKTSDVNRRLKSQIWSSVVTLVLVEGKNLPTVDPETGSCDSYVKFRLGNEKYKSRVFWRSTTPRWLEQFDLHLYDDGDQQLEVTVWDKERSRDDYIGRCVIDLTSMEREVTHGFWQDLEEGEGSLYFLLTISGTTASETISDLSTYEDNPTDKEGIEHRYVWRQSFNNIKDVGHLTVKVFRATGLAAADLGGKSDPFCVLELGNARLQTQTEYKTLSPCWNKIFTFNVKDINNILEVTVFDEDRDHKVEFLGKLVIPLLRIRNDERRWYPLKDKKLRSRAKGSNPQILLEMTVIWNPIRACIRTLNPKEEKYMQQEVKFKRQVFVRNVLRLKAVAMHFIELGKLLNGCFEWESTLRSFLALLLWLVLCYYFEPWMIPAFGLLYFLKQYLVKSLTGGGPSLPAGDQDDSDLEDDEDDDKDKEEKKSLKERLQAIQEVTQSVQNYIGYIASLGESVKNIFNFTVPFLSWIAICLLVAASIVLYFIPIRYLLMLWGANKFARRLLRPHCVPNNEVLDLLSRVPDDEMLLDFRELKALPGPEQPDRRKEHRKKHKVS